MKKTIEPQKIRGELDYSELSEKDRSLVEDAVKSGYSRRHVLKLMAVTGVSLATAQNLLSTGGQAMAMTPKKGGSIRFASNLHGPDDKLFPQQFTSTIDYTRGRATYNGLCQLGEGIVPQPELATEWASNSNATEWTFQLRKGVTFHDGTPFTADDVVYTMNRHLVEDSTSTIKSVLASIKEWKKVNSHEVKVEMNSPNSDLPILMGLFQSKIVKNGTTGDGIGTGPFVQESFEPGIKSVHRRNPDYWRDGANLDSIEITAITDPAARVNALLAGDVQIIAIVDPKSFKQVEETGGVDLLSIPAALQLGICCLKNGEPGSNDDFVKGMQYIQDRERIVKKILRGKGSVGNDHPITFAHGGDFCEALPQREFDPDKAKFHFEKSGYSSAELHVAPVQSGIEDMCLLAQANAAKIGFDLKVKKVPTDGYWGAVWMSAPLNVVTWNMRPTANSQIAIQFAPGAEWNDTYWNNERMGELLTLSLSETDPVKREAMYCEMQELIHNGSGMVIPAFSNINDGIASNVMGIPQLPLGQVGGNEWPEFVWLA
ncbi:MAG: ABC transporter substrate-binding protein [Gammaproteobacteria bacterium]|nr:ABC transporter substrate-binding protein [Gammaproteobacteria bacterium]MCY4226690.1 ABC transporter substrate-binding protein [Gammaproteobacteria bacterium]